VTFLAKIVMPEYFIAHCSKKSLPLKYIRLSSAFSKSESAAWPFKSLRFRLINFHPAINSLFISRDFKMERKNFAKKVVISLLVASFAISTLSACQDSNATTSKTARNKTTTYSTK